MFLCINLPNLIEFVSFVQYKCQKCHYLPFFGIKFDLKVLCKKYILQLYFVDGKHNSFDLSRNGQPLDNS